MATHSSILVREIPWTVEPGKPQSMGLQELAMTERPNHHHRHLLAGFPGGSVVNILPANG